MEVLIRNRVVSSNVVQVWHLSYNMQRQSIRNEFGMECFRLTLASELVDELGLPEKHWVPLVLGCFLLK